MTATQAREARQIREVRGWPVVLLALPAFVAIWSGWVGLGGLTGFGKVNPLPGTPLSGWTLDTAITLPIGMEVYAAFALRVWLAGRLPERATRFAKWSAIGSLVLGAAGQVAYHLMSAAGITKAPWWITTLVACLPVAVLGMGAALAHLIRDSAIADAGPPAARAADEAEGATAEVPAPTPAPRLPRKPLSSFVNYAGDSMTVHENYAGDTVITPTRQRVGGTTRTRAADQKSTRAAQAAKTAATVTRLRARHPDWTVAQIAAKAGVTDRTVRRHLNATQAPPATDAAPAAGAVPDAADAAVRAA